MALKMTLVRNVFDQDVTVKDAYIRVASINGTKNLLHINVDICDKQGVNVYEQLVYTCKPSMDAENFIAQAYKFLKTTDEFSDAIDC